MILPVPGEVCMSHMCPSYHAIHHSNNALFLVDLQYFFPQVFI